MYMTVCVHKPHAEVSLFYSFRVFCYKLVCSKAFNVITYVTIFLGSVLLALEIPITTSLGDGSLLCLVQVHFVAVLVQNARLMFQTSLQGRKFPRDGNETTHIYCRIHENWHLSKKRFACHLVLIVIDRDVFFLSPVIPER